MNIRDKLYLNDLKPAVFPIRRTDKGNITAIGLKKGQVLKEHKTSFLTTLVVLQGKIHFVTGEEAHELEVLDFFDVPSDVYHKVIAKEESIFVLIQEKHNH